jgi:hypothetical protein
MMNLWERTFGSNIHTVRYEELVANPEKEGAALLKAVGLNWDPKFLDFHTSASARGGSTRRSWRHCTKLCWPSN